MSADIEAVTSVASGAGVADQAGGFIVTVSSAAETAALRQAVLRPQLTIEQMALGGDQNPDTVYLAARVAPRAPTDHSTVVGCVRLEPVRCPWPQVARAWAGHAWQLRAMATDPSVRGKGLGRLLVEAAVAHVTDQGRDLIWCNARISAAGFYSRLGFTGVTGEFAVSGVAEPHIGMVREL